jgi:hypothetical protein
MRFESILILSLWVNASALVSPISNAPTRIEVPSWNRRVAFGSIVSVGALLVGSRAAVAASQDEIDKENIVKGYRRLSYLLDHWEEKTTNCK